MNASHAVAIPARRLRATLLAAVSLALALAAPAQAAPGRLDPLFGPGATGWVTTGIGPADNFDVIWSLAIAPDGKVLVGGYADMGAGAGGNEFALARYNADGSLDTTFDGDGKLTTGIGPADRFDGIESLAITPDGKVVAGGRANMGPDQGGSQFALARYNLDGTLDTTFDGDGKLTTGIGPADNFDAITSLAIAPDGKITVGGEANMGAGAGGKQFALARYNANGTLDTTFDGDGKLTTGIGPADNSDVIWSLAIAPDGKVVAGGRAGMGAGGDQFALARYNADGSVDTTFDGDGKLTTGIGPADNSDGVNALAITPDGRVVAGGSADMGAGQGGEQFALARYNADGSLDMTFDGDGKLTTGIGPADNSDGVNALALTSDGKITAGGGGGMGAGQGGDQFALARYNADGSVDTTFDTDGKLTSGTVPGDNLDLAYALALTSDGRITVGGYADMGVGGGGMQFALARYLGVTPETVITAGPAASATIATPTAAFEFSATPTGSGASFQCSIDDGPFLPCSTPHTTAALANGAHSFAVRALDGVGDPDPTPATRAFRVAAPKDTTAPRVTFTKRAIKRLARARALLLTARCDEDCTLAVTVKITLKRAGKKTKATVIALKRVSVKAKAGRAAKLRFALSKKARARLRRALRAGARATLAITTRATDTAGNRATTTRRIKAGL